MDEPPIWTSDDPHTADQSAETLPDELDLVLLLHRICSASGGSPPLSKIGDVVNENQGLRDELAIAFTTKAYSSIAIQVPKIFPEVFSHINISDLPSQDLISSYDAFNAPYQGESHLTLIKTMEIYLRTGHPDTTQPIVGVHNNSMPIVQSSGMGKSRMVDMAAQLRIAFPFSLREIRDQDSYPPSDNVVPGYMLPYNYGDVELQVRYYAFLCAVFEIGKEIFEKNKFYNSQSPALDWYKYLSHGHKANYVGANRSKFYEDVVNRAKEMRREFNAHDGYDHLYETLMQKCEEFLAPLKNEAFDAEPLRNGCFFYFDDAHALNRPPNERQISEGRARTAYSNFGAVLRALTYRPVFFLFLSTDPRVEPQIPPPKFFPSSRVRPSALIPAYTELPFDALAKQLFSNLKRDGPVTLNRVCSTNTIVHFGRPLWASEHKSGRTDVIKFALRKLAGPEYNRQAENADYAALSTRILIHFNTEVGEARRRESELVESHLRVVYAVPMHREFMRAGSPSEPIVAEAAARHLDPECNGALKTKGPDILAKALVQGLLGHKERNELVARLLITVAHDLTVANLEQRHSTTSENEPKFHRPISLMGLLESLFHPDWHDTIRNAMPLDSDNSTPSLQEAFKDAYLNFSHFALADDYEASKLEHSWKALIRGFAFQAPGHEHSFDLVNPILFGDPNATEISQSVASLLHWQARDHEDEDGVFVNPMINNPNKNMPLLSIVLEFGAKNGHGVTIQQNTTQYASQSTDVEDVNRRHYVIVARGATAKVFNAISEESEGIYKALLAPAGVFDEFTRNGSEFPENRKDFVRVKSTFTGTEEMEEESWDWGD